MKIKILFISSLILTIFFGNSCRLLRPSDMFKTDKDYPKSEFEVSKNEYIIQPFDKIGLRVVSNTGESFFGTGSMENANANANYQRNQHGFEFLVEFDGKIKLPILGRIDIAGKTIREAELLLEKEYSNYFIEPFVLVQVINRKVMIFMDGGTKASVVEMPNDNFTLIEAIAQVGGVTDISRSYRIKLIRGNLTQNPEVFYWNISNIKELKNSNILLEANDIIYIDSRPQYFTRALREVSPYLTLITTLVTIYGVFFKLKQL
jgi:polysaccharide export outer membrane protein